MKLDGRRESRNVEDRRGQGSKVKMAAGGGIMALIIGVVMAIMQGGDPQQAIQQGVNSLKNGAPATEQTDYKPSAQEQELYTFASKVLAGTEDVWTAEFKKMGREYIQPHLVIYTDATPTSCGQGQACMGPFYCSADETVYLDLSFFMEMKKSLGADGDFAYAYVIAHEVGHHVQHLLGTLNDAHAQMARYGNNSKQANEISVRLELQADFYAGVWAYHDNKKYGSIEPGDVEEAINCASKIGDDYLQEKARRYSVPETFTHGTSAQRMKWLKLGLQTGDINRGDTFSPSYKSL